MKEIRIPLPGREDVDEALVGLLKFFLESEAKSKIYLFLRKKGTSTSRMIAKGANLYPSSTREALANMTKSGVVTRNKLETTGSGKKPFVYEAIPPGELLKIKLGGIETLLNRLQNLDVYIRGERTVTYRRGPYKVRIEKLIDENGEERVFIESEGGENQKEDTDDKVKQGS